jgi:hypothetical protein
LNLVIDQLVSDGVDGDQREYSCDVWQYLPETTVLGKTGPMPE